MLRLSLFRECMIICDVIIRNPQDRSEPENSKQPGIMFAIPERGRESAPVCSCTLPHRPSQRIGVTSRLWLTCIDMEYRMKFTGVQRTLKQRDAITSNHFVYHQQGAIVCWQEPVDL